ncbi:peptidoglycan-binding protein [Aurantimonas sp. 22II-16-19i]|uniref:peptidoglycan-binding protein n=1 Tax=Aurantimonas sp. 22II-16-19i TaxID=1317114 RepID=UPI0009F7B743|nr:peptidoglycan-binding protein [Aurantimonas sp. 22II-16-19i]ORE90166.1 peptidoglycan-binding domain 1 protein [Aurantimonas sp. 22II-16-19i]
MADLSGMAAGRRQGGHEATSLESLNRTLEELETRLSRLTASHARAAADLRREESRAPYRDEVADAAPRRVAAGGGAAAPRADLSQAVSQIVLRQRALNRQQAARHAPCDDHAAEDVAAGKAVDEPAATQKVAALPTVAAAAEQGAVRGNVPSGPTITQQLERLREELRADMAKSFQPRFDDMRDAVDDLRRMIAERASTDRIDAEIARVNDGLARMATNGADNSGVESLRAELESIKTLVKDLAREESLNVADRKWDDIRATITSREEANTSERRDIKDQLERLRLSLGGLASEEHVKAVERRWDEFESRYLDKPEKEEGADLTELLKSEMAHLREKLETLASEQSVKAVEARWGSLEERFASRAIEENMAGLAGRMEQLELTLSKLPGSLALEPIETRLKALAEGLEALGRNRVDETETAHFQAIDERLDEISRAIVAAATKAPPVDMSPVERVEARLQSLSNRVDGLAEADVDAMSARIAELADRIESLSNGPAIAMLTERIESFSTQLDALAGFGEAQSPDISAIEARLAGLSDRLEMFAVPGLDPEIVAALEAQIVRLSDRIAEVGSLTALSDPDLDERLATIEFRIEENRESILESAEAAAEAAVRRMMETGAGGQNGYVEQLAGDLRELQAMSRASGEQSQGFYEAMHQTLLKLVDRIDRIDSELVSTRETTIQGEASASTEGRAPAPELVQEAAPQGLRALLKRRTPKRAEAPAPRDLPRDPWHEPEFAPQSEVNGEFTRESRYDVEPAAVDGEADALTAREVNRPLAVGSGQPDIVSLIERVRAQQAGRADAEDHGGKADFIAAARRAALAAAAEADAMRTSRDPGEEDEQGEGFVATVQRRRKPILLAVSAVLLALLAIPLGQMASGILTDERPAEQARTAPDEAPAPAASSEPGPAMPSAPVLTPETGGAASDGPQVRSSGETEFSPLAAPASGADAPKVGFSLEDGAGQAGFAGAGEAAAAPQAGDAPADAPVVSDVASEADTGGAAATAGAGEVPATTRAQPVAAAELPALPEGLASAPLTEAAKAGDPKALFEIGLRLMEGRVGDPDPKLAAQWFQLAADRDFAPAEYSLGTLYEKGNGVERDLARARDAYLAAADGGNVRAMHNLAVLYATGIDGKSAPAEAAKWFEKAASYGMPDSQYNLGILYARGAGVDQDLARSYKWFSIVAKSGDTDAAAKRDEIRKALTPAQLKVAETQITDFQPLARNEAANTVDIPKDWSGASEQTETSSIDMARAIRNIQAILIKLGYEPGAPDGVIGGKTTEAIMAFQKDSGLQPSGKVDETLIRKLLERKDG